MDKYEASQVIEKQLCKEVELIAESIQKNGSIAIQELEKLDKLYHTLKGKTTYEAMKDSEEYQNGSHMRGNSGYRNPSHMSGNSYADGYSQGYAEAMNQMNHIPYDRNPRW